MTSTSLCVGHAERLSRAFALHWGLEEEPLRNHLIAQLKRMPASALRDEAAAESLLERAALDFRNTALRPILRDLFDYLRARLSHKLGGSCLAYRDDAVSQTLVLLLEYWKPWWSRPEGQEHLRRYGAVAVVHAALRILRGEKSREAHLPGAGDLPSQAAVDPETEAIQRQEDRQRARAEQRLRDLDWLLEAGLSQAEAHAVIRFLTPSPAAGLDRRAEAAWRKALQRGKARLKTVVDQLTSDGGQPLERDRAVPTYATVDSLGLRGRYRVADCTAHGLWLEGAEDEADLEPGANCTVHVHYRAAVIARGARVVFVERTDRHVRIALEFDFQPCHRPTAVEARPTL